MPKYLHSLSHLSVLGETPVFRVREILDQIGAQPAMVLDLCPYYAAAVAGTVIARAKGWSDQPAYHRVYHGDAGICTEASR